MIFTTPSWQAAPVTPMSQRKKGSERSDPELGLGEEKVAEHEISASSLCLHIHLFPEVHGCLRVHDLRIVSLWCFEDFCR